MKDTRKISYTLRGEDDPQGVLQLRITVGKCTVLQMAEYRSKLREVFDWYSEETDNPYLEAETDIEDVDDEHWPYFLAGLRRARMLAAASNIETRNGDGKDWSEDVFPKEWVDLDSFINGVPTLLFEAWDKEALELNPGLWSSDTENDSKKEGWLSVD